MNPLYEKAKDLVLIRRTSDNKEFEEYPLLVQPQSVLMTDPANNVICFGACGLHVAFAISSSYSNTSSYAYTASYAFQAATSSFAWFALSSSFANSASYCVSSSNAISASWADSASYATETSAALFAVSASIADYAISASHALYADSASYAFSASYALSASYGANFFAPRVTSSYVSASNIIWANEFRGYKGNFAQLTASDMLVTDVAIETASYAITANTSLDSAFATTAGIATFAVSASTALYATNSISASHAIMSDASISSSYSQWSDNSGLANMVKGLYTVNVPVNTTVPSVLIGSGNGNENNPHATIKVNNKLYCAGWNGFIYVANDPDGDLTNVTTASFMAGNYVAAVCYSNVTGYLYFINGDSSHPSLSGSITRVDPNDIVHGQHVIVQGLPGNGTLNGIATDGNFLYTATNGNFYKFDINTGAIVSSSAWVSGSTPIGGCHAAVISSDNQYVYFTTAGGVIAKVRCSDLSYITTQLYDGFNFLPVINDDIAYMNGYVYASSDSGDVYVYKINANDLSYNTYYNGQNSYGCYADGVNVYVLCNGGYIQVYYGGDMASGPATFTVFDFYPNELWITNQGRFVYTIFNLNTPSTMFREVNLPISQLGLDKYPYTTVDVAGVINADIQIQTPIISCSNALTVGTTAQHGNITLYDPASIRSNLGSNFLTLSSSLVRATRISGSAALLGYADNVQFSQSFGFGTPLAVTRSLGNVPQDGMYRIHMAATIGFYSGSTVTAPPSWSFKHTDRLATYNLPFVPLATQISATPYDTGFIVSGDYTFQAVGGTHVEYYWYGPDLSSTHCSASFFTTVTLAQILSGSVTGSI